MAIPIAQSRRRTPGQLAAAIRKLPADREVVDPRKWYKTQKEHWLGWLSEYGGPGAYGRNVFDRDARFAYNHIVEPKMLLWLMSAARVPRRLVTHAKDVHMRLAGKSFAQQSGAIRQIVSWDAIEKALWG